MRVVQESKWRYPRTPQYSEVEARWSSSSRRVLEIGCGVGFHPISLAQENPDHLIVAIERTREKFEKFQGRLNKHDLSNLVGIQADVVPWLVHAPGDFLFHKIWLLYPNPEKNNANQRWLRSPSFALIIKRLVKSGELELATNLRWYAEEAADCAQRIWGLRVSFFEYQGPARSHFEKKYLQRCEACWGLRIEL
ncbi:MAG: methyltransferase domain-containing protein [Bdellovibrio sp.]